jgi:hypothetical protein
MKYEYTMLNLKTNHSFRKIQKTAPRIKGYICTAREKILPLYNSTGERLFYDANNWPYYAKENKTGFHYQP